MPKACLALVGLVLCSSYLSAKEVANDAKDGFVSIFDGKTLKGWRALPKEGIDDWSVREGVLVAKGSKDALIYLVYGDEDLANFELKLKYKMVTKGNSGVEVRAHVDKTCKRPFEGYHADFGHVGIGPQVLGAWDFHFAKREEYACHRGTSLLIDKEGKTKSKKLKDAVRIEDINKHGWNDLHIVANGRKLSFSINGKTASEFVDRKPERLKSGIMGLQIHDAGMIVEFKDIMLKRLPKRGGKKQNKKQK